MNPDLNLMDQRVKRQLSSNSVSMYKCAIAFMISWPLSVSAYKNHRV